MNRVNIAIADARKRVELLSPEKREHLEKEMAITFLEHYSYQNRQAQAHATGKLTTDEAQVLYVALGEGFNESNGGWAKGTDLATKVVVTQVIGKLMGVE